MSNFRTIDRQTGYLLPPSVDEWLPERHLARFIVEVIDGLDLGRMSGAYRGSGSASYHPADVAGAVGLRLCDGGIFEPQAGAGDLQLGGVSVHRGERSSRPRHDRHVSAAVLEGDREAVRRGSSVGARDGRAEDGHDRTGRDEDPRQREPAQRAFLRVRGQARGATEGRGRRFAGQGRGGGQVGCSRRHVDPRRTGAARGASAQDRRGAGDDRGAGQGAARAREGGARSQDGGARGQDRRDGQEARRQTAGAAG